MLRFRKCVRQKIGDKIGVLCKKKVSQKLTITLVFKKKDIFVENWREPPQKVVITLTLGANPTYDFELQRQRCKNLQRHAF
jgi:hypothetical protein